MRTLLRKWRTGWSADLPVSSGMEGPISLRLQGGLIRSVAQEPREESGEDGQSWDFEVVIARPGYSRDGKWFLTPGVLRAAAPLFEGTQAFANHAPPEGPDIKNMSGSIPIGGDVAGESICSEPSAFRITGGGWPAKLTSTVPSAGSTNPRAIVTNMPRWRRLHRN